MCFKGGRLEASISLPGRGDTVGFWPGFWAMGNLGRPGYAATTDGMWPYSYDDVCDAGITANQSSSDGINYLPGMRLPACTCAGEDHPNRGKSRSAPEIDAVEASVGFLDKTNQIGMVSQSFQVAPFDIWYQPDYSKCSECCNILYQTDPCADFVEVPDPKITSMNVYKGGPFQQAVSGITNLNNDWYDGKGYQTYAFEYTPGRSGDMAWYVGEDYVWKMDARALSPNGNIGQRVFPEEPMAMIMNFGMSPGFSALNLTGIAPLLPATMRFDYVRIYQDDTNVGCDPEGYETTGYINDHYDVYTNPNVTSWYAFHSHYFLEHVKLINIYRADTKYSWPKNSLLGQC